ncbi:6359_t:CDS:1, partial [Ambispora gerdemannii]
SNMSFASEKKFQETIEKLKEQVTESLENALKLSNTLIQVSYPQDHSLMSLFYDDYNTTLTFIKTSIELELHIY